MAVNYYECLFLLDPNKSSSDWQGVMSSVNGLIEKTGAEIVFTRPWGEPKLAFPVKKFRKGAYLLTYFKVESRKLAGFEEDCRLNDNILRHLVIKLHPKIANEIIQHLSGQGDAPPVDRHIADEDEGVRGFEDADLPPPRPRRQRESSMRE